MSKPLEHEVKLGNERLLILAAFLDELDEKRFDFQYVVGGYWKGNPDLSCGTTACALGWATTIPALRDAGMRPLAILQTGRVFNDATKVFAMNLNEVQDVFDPSTVFDAPWLGEALGEAPDDDPDRWTAKRVATHIRRFVAWRSEL